MRQATTASFRPKLMSLMAPQLQMRAAGGGHEHGSNLKPHAHAEQEHWRGSHTVSSHTVARPVSWLVQFEALCANAPIIAHLLVVHLHSKRSAGHISVGGSAALAIND